MVCANTLRALGSDAFVDLFARRPETAYTPRDPPLVLRGALGFGDMFHASPGWFAKNLTGLRTGCAVESSDARLDGVTFHLARGETVDVDWVVAAKGVRPDASRARGNFSPDANRREVVTDLAGVAVEPILRDRTGPDRRAFGENVANLEG